MARILIVEDDVELANFVRSYLEFENHSVEMFHNGREGREKLLNLQTQYDLVMLDWEIPEVSGIEMLKEYRDKGGSSPVLMLTGKDQSEDKESGLDTGADDYLTKPFDMKELGARIRALLRRAKATPKLPSIGDITLDRDSHRALQNGKSVALTAREFQFLEFLTSHVGVELQPDEYMKQVWSDQPDIDQDILKNTVKRLRKKLDPEGKLICPHLFVRNSESSPSLQSGDNSTEPPEPGSGMRLLMEGIDEDDDIDLLLGSIIGNKYELLEQIGAGGTGLVYKAKHRQLGKMVAVKLLFPHLACSPEMVKRFRREAQTVMGLSHQNIMTVHDFGVTEEGQPYIVMELISGGSVTDLIESSGKVQLSTALHILKQTCDGLAFAHDHGAIHRDIKPSNIMLVAENEHNYQVKLVDFGFAKITQGDARLEKLTRTGEVLGSPPYMSPEQCRGLPLDQRTDVYALGCVIYEMLTGQRAFDGRDPIDTIMKQVTQEPPHLVLDGVDPRVRGQLDRITQKCLAKELKDRYPSIHEIRSELDKVIVDDKPLESKSKPSSFLAKAKSWFGQA